MSLRATNGSVAISLHNYEIASVTPFLRNDNLLSAFILHSDLETLFLDSIGNYMLSKRGIRGKDSFPLSAKLTSQAEGIGILGKNHQGFSLKAKYPNEVRILLENGSECRIFEKSIMTDIVAYPHKGNYDRILTKMTNRWFYAEPVPGKAIYKICSEKINFIIFL